MTLTSIIDSIIQPVVDKYASFFETEPAPDLVIDFSEDVDGRGGTETKPLPVVVNNKSNSHLYALLIGINTYPNLTHLTGGVSDATAMSKFLTTDLKVPPDHIITLLDGQATRSAIIQAFKSLREDPRIRRGDPILVFYAGHGGLVEAPEEWRVRYGYDKAQVVYPYDFGMKAGGSGESVQCIPDQTVGALLNQLAAAKGNNITVIFDSCHSASGDRSEYMDRAVPGRIVRDAGVEVTLPPDIDSDILPHRLAALHSPGELEEDPRRPEPPFYTDQGSHIHFAACGSEEKAWEENGQGVFTAALLKCIRASGVDKISYRDLMLTLPLLPKQNPHCYGVHKSRILFDSRVPSRNITFIPVKLDRGAWLLQAGASSGVTSGSLWEVHVQPLEGSKSLGRFQAEVPKISSTALVPESGSGSAGNATLDRVYARLIRSGNGNELRVYFTPEAKQTIFPPGTGNKGAVGTVGCEVGYVFHPARDSADLVVELQTGGKEVEYTLCDPQAQKYGVAKLKPRTLARRDQVERVLFAASRWCWHLRRTSSQASQPSPGVSMEFLKIGEMQGGIMVPSREPLENLNRTGVVDFRVQKKDRHGIRLSSQVSKPIYVKVFYFDTTDLSIVNMFGHSQANDRPDAEIKGREQLMVGDQLDGGAALYFGLDPGAVLDVGFVKVFWSTDPLELDSITQGSAFDVDKDGRGVGPKKPKYDSAEWGTVLVTLVQRGG